MQTCRGSTEMLDGNLLSDALLAHLYDVLRDFVRTNRLTTEFDEETPRKSQSLFLIHAVILDADLDAPASFLDEPTGSTDPGDPNATICLWSKADNKYTQTEKRLAVSNHSTTDHAIDTPGAAIAINGHYWFFGDCDPIVDRPTPPWDEEE